MQKTRITFWGVRGSSAAAGPETVRYGGNTPCVEISYGNTVIICDAGTGIRPLSHRRATILLSHLHLDHVIGLPFFEPIYKKGNRFVIMCPGRSSAKLKSDLKKLIGPPYFPINILDVPAKLILNPPLPPFTKGGSKLTPPFTKGGVGGFIIGNIKVEAFECNHPDKSYAFKFHLPDGKVVVYASDNEPSDKRDAAFIRWLKNANLLIHDAQYTPKQYKNKTGWGHSPYLYPIRLAKEAGVKRLFLFHYDPSATDKDLDCIKLKARKFVKAHKLNVDVDLSCEGMKILV